MQDATCCDDHQHCCPNNLPVCDTIAGRCLSGNADDWESSVPWSTKVRAWCGRPGLLHPTSRHAHVRKDIACTLLHSM